MRAVRAVYFDTSAIRELAGLFAAPEYQNLRSSADILDVALVLPRMVAIELAAQRLRDVAAECDRARQSANRLDRITGVKLSLLIPSDMNERARAVLAKEIADAGLQEAPIPSNVDLEGLAAMAAHREPPFEAKGEKGFRDSLVILSAVEHMKENRYSTALLVARDEMFSNTDTAKLWKDLDLKVVKTCADAADHLGAFLDSAVKKAKTARESQLRRFLENHNDEVFRFVLERAEISPSQLKAPSTTLMLPYGAEVHEFKKITGVQPIGIGTVSIPAFDLDSITASEREVHFGVLVRFTGIVAEYDSGFRIADLLSPPRVPLGELPSYTPAPVAGRVIEREVAVQREITVIASVREEGGNYSDLNLVQTIGS